jgi:replication factor A1
MEVKDVQANQGNIDLVVEVVSKEEPRTFEKFGKEGRVCNAKVKDETGELKLTLWNDDVDKVSVGDKIHIENGWCSEYRDEKQLSSGKFGKIEVVSKSEQAAASEEQSKEMFTNDPSILQQAGGEELVQDSGEKVLEGQEDLSEPVEEELVE